MRRILFLLVIMMITIIILSACAPGVTHHTEMRRAGFFWGIWHGWIAPVSLIWQLFNPEVRIYEVHNNGWWYDLGFYIAIIGGFGSIAITRRRKKRV